MQVLIPNEEKYIIRKHSHLILHGLLELPDAGPEDCPDKDGRVAEWSRQFTLEELHFFTRRVMILGTYPAQEIRPDL